MKTIVNRDVDELRTTWLDLLDEDEENDSNSTPSSGKWTKTVWNLFKGAQALHTALIPAVIQATALIAIVDPAAVKKVNSQQARRDLVNQLTQAVEQIRKTSEHLFNKWDFSVIKESTLKLVLLLRVRILTITLVAEPNVIAESMFMLIVATDKALRSASGNLIKKYCNTDSIDKCFDFLMSNEETTSRLIQGIDFVCEQVTNKNWKTSYLCAISFQSSDVLF